MAVSRDKWARLEALARGETLDHPAWSLWRHFYDEEQSAEGLAEAMVAWQRAYDFDFLKVNPRAQYHVEPWGAAWSYPGGGRRPARVNVPVHETDDWKGIGPQDPSTGAFGEQLAALSLIRQQLGPDLPIVETIFTPLSVLGDMVDDPARLIRDMRGAPDLVLATLAVVTQTLVAFSERCLEEGADGIFLATTEWARRDVITLDEYARFGRPFDLQMLDAVKEARFNVLHFCGDDAFVEELADYPAHALSWKVTSPGTPSIADAATCFPGILVGGVSHEALTADGPEKALTEAAAALGETSGRRWMLGGNCSIPVNSQRTTLAALNRWRFGG